MREISVVEQRYQAVLAVISDGRTVTEVASRWAVSRQTLHAWLARYEQSGLEGLADQERAEVPCAADPRVLATRAPVSALESRRIEPGALLWRIHRASGAHVSPWNKLRTFGPADARFDPHPLPLADLQSFGVLYLGDSAVAARAEAFQLRRAIDRHTDTPYLIGLRLARPIELLDLVGIWPTRADASQANNTGPRARARGWARGIRQPWPDLEGFAYRSSMRGGSICFAL
jgi:transposase-like protein